MYLQIVINMDSDALHSEQDAELRLILSKVASRVKELCESPDTKQAQWTLRDSHRYSAGYASSWRGSSEDHKSRQSA